MSRAFWQRSTVRLRRYSTADSGSRSRRSRPSSGDPSGDLDQAVAVVGDGAHRCRSFRIAAQCAEVDQTADHSFRLAIRGSGIAKLRQDGQPTPLRRSQRPTVEWQTRTRCPRSQRRSSSVVAPAWRMAMSSLAKRSRREPRRRFRRWALDWAFRRATSTSASKAVFGGSGTRGPSRLGPRTRPSGFGGSRRKEHGRRVAQYRTNVQLLIVYQ